MHFVSVQVIDPNRLPGHRVAAMGRHGRDHLVAIAWVFCSFGVSLGDIVRSAVG